MNRKQCTSYSNTSYTLTEIKHGVPQDSILGTPAFISVYGFHGSLNMANLLCLQMILM